MAGGSTATLMDSGPREEAARPARMRGHSPPPAALPYNVSVALLRRATSCFGFSTNVNESFSLIAAALDEDLGLEVDVGAALNFEDSDFEAEHTGGRPNVA